MTNFLRLSTVDALPLVQRLVGYLQIPSINTIVTGGADSDHMVGIMGVIDVPFMNVMYLDEDIGAPWISALIASLLDEQPLSCSRNGWSIGRHARHHIR